MGLWGNGSLRALEARNPDSNSGSPLIIIFKYILILLLNTRQGMAGPGEAGRGKAWLGAA